MRTACAHPGVDRRWRDEAVASNDVTRIFVFVFR
jgi:hypothetical protein